MNRRVLLGIILAAPLWAQPVTVRVTRRELVRQPVSRMIYGNFIESGFGRQVDGLWAEMLFNRSFEKLPPQRRRWLQYGEEADLSKSPWWHSGYEESQWKLDKDNPDAELATPNFMGFHHGKLSASVVNRSGEKAATLRQDGLVVRKGARYRFRGYARPALGRPGGLPHMVTVSLPPLGAVQQTLLAADWTELKAEFASGDYEGRAALAVSVPPGAAVVFDDFSLMPADNLDGWRRDAVELLQSVRPAIIRFPGGCFATFYHWRDGIGPASARRPQESDFWGGLEYNDAGTDEFVRLCRLLKAEPFPVVNMMSGTPDEAADWVAYCNAPASHPLGKLRAANGHAAPYGIRYWELDNETFRKWSVAEYARECERFSKAMKAVDPAIQLVACHYGPFAQATTEFLNLAGRYIDLLSDRAKGERHLRRKLAAIREYNRRTGRNIRLCNTEWLAPWAEVDPDADQGGAPLLNTPDRKMPIQEKQITWRYAMNTAKTLLMFQRLGGEFAFANFNNMANSWGQNVIECPKERAFLSAAGRVMELYASSPAAWPLALEGEGRDFELQVQASLGLDRRSLVIDVVNSRAMAVPLRVDMSALRLAVRSARFTELRAEALTAHNTSQNTDAVSKKSWTGEAGKELVLTVPPLSVTQVLVR